MTITTIPNKRGTKVFKTVEVAFEYSDDVHTWHVIAQVETNGDDYKCIMIDGADEASDHVHACIEQKAEEKAWEQENKPRNWKGCNCVPSGSGTLAEVEHEQLCPLKLQGEEREAFNDLLRKEKREAHRFSRSEYEQEQRRRIDENTDIYLNLK